MVEIEGGWHHQIYNSESGRGCNTEKGVLNEKIWANIDPPPLHPSNVGRWICVLQVLYKNRQYRLIKVGEQEGGEKREG